MFSSLKLCKNYFLAANIISVHSNLLTLNPKNCFLKVPENRRIDYGKYDESKCPTCKKFEEFIEINHFLFKITFIEVYLHSVNMFVHFFEKTKITKYKMLMLTRELK